VGPPRTHVPVSLALPLLYCWLLLFFLGSFKARQPAARSIRSQAARSPIHPSLNPR
jgi:hypothetical protein